MRAGDIAGLVFHQHPQVGALGERRDADSGRPLLHPRDLVVEAGHQAAIVLVGEAAGARHVIGVQK